MEKREIMEKFNAIHGDIYYNNLELARERLSTYAMDHCVNLPPIEFHSSNLRVSNPAISLYSNSKSQFTYFGFVSHAKDTPFEDRQKLATFLSHIVLECIPEIRRRNPSSQINTDMASYFANKILINYSHINGSILRPRYAGSSAQIKSLESENNRLLRSLASNEGKYANEVFSEVFSSRQTSSKNPHELLLLHERKSVMDKINEQRREKYEMQLMQSFYGTASPASPILDKAIGQLYIQIKDNYKKIYIHYPNEEDMVAQRAMASKLPYTDPLLTVRMIVAHELGHLALHAKIPLDDSKEKVILHDKTSAAQDQEATYYARLMLERRELLYNNMQEDKAYNEACAKIHACIREYFSVYGKDWLKWVLD